jgi:hypothetical protein
MGMAMNAPKSPTVVPSVEPKKWHRIIDGQTYHIMGRASFVEKATGLTVLCPGATMWRESTRIGYFPGVAFTFFADMWCDDVTS